MKVSDFDFEVPSRLIATRPSAERASARLLHLSTQEKAMEDAHFQDLPQILKKGDLLIVNESRVLKARFLGTKKLTGGKVEGLYLNTESPDRIRIWLKGRVTEGDLLSIEGFGEARVVARQDKEAVLAVSSSSAFLDFLEKKGDVPLPPYIRAERKARGEKGADLAEVEDDAHYRSVFEKPDPKIHSVAASTAALHFDEALTAALSTNGISILKIRLGVGAGTFEPLEKEVLEENKLHAEEVFIEPSVWSQIKSHKKAGGRVVAVGTTVVRSLESAALREIEGLSTETFMTSLFIVPSFRFQIVDALITNFHWPRSSLLALVSAFIVSRGGSSDLWKKAYECAIERNYRLFSYGDGMLIES